MLEMSQHGAGLKAVYPQQQCESINLGNTNLISVLGFGQVYCLLFVRLIPDFSNITFCGLNLWLKNT